MGVVNGVTLTAAEREALRGLGQGQVPMVVEAILTARLAAVEALADEWEAVGTVSVYESAGELAQMLRAALATGEAQ